jgi:hypothetical protein
VSTECSLCLAPRVKPCKECHQPVPGPIFESITVRKRKPAFIRRERLRLCEECSSEVWAAFTRCKTREATDDA